MREIGLHLHIDSTLKGLAQRASDLHIKIFQCFLAQKTESRLISFEPDDMNAFLAVRDTFGDIFLHSSYWVNLAATDRTHHPLLEQELALAKKLEFTHIVLHAGSARGARTKDQALDALARTVDWLLLNNHGLTIVLENAAHGGKALGCDIRDFRALLKRLDQPEKLRFCIDVAHAYLFGYDLSFPKGQDAFIALVDDIMGWNKVALIHLNDTQEPCGSKIDQHYSVGDGKIGDDALKRFIKHEKIAHIPVIMEVPMLSFEKQKELLEKVRSWQC